MRVVLISVEAKEYVDKDQILEPTPNEYLRTFRVPLKENEFMEDKMLELSNLLRGLTSGQSRNSEML